MELPILIGIAVLAAVVVLFIVLKKKSKSKTDWPMDPRLKAMAEWAYSCMLEVTGLPVGEKPVPNVKGTTVKWSPTAAASFYRSTRSIQMLINLDPNRLPHIMLHEMGHDGFDRLYGLGTTATRENFANWVNNQCKPDVHPEMWPAPKVDWDA